MCAVPLVPPKCPHNDFWFDRTISYCLNCSSEHMDDVCIDCGKTTCVINSEGRR